MSEEPSSNRTCPKCGTALAADSVEGLCPACLLALNLATQTQLPEEFGPNGTRKVPPTPKSPPTPEDIGSQFPQFEILECLGRGGMGVVYKARQKSLDRLVALKILAPEREKDPQFAERFAREARTLAQLSHPSIVTVHDFGEANGMFYLVMEFVDGVNLRQLLRERKLSPEEALAVVPPICEALQYAHQQGVIHRDIKPENLLLDKQGRIKIADFGIAKILGRTADKTGQRQSAALHGVEGTASSVPTHSQQTSEGPALTRNQTIGTPQYMAPEQTAFPQRVDHRADIYSLGVVLYEMLTGELPGAKLQPPSKKVQVDVRIDEIVLRALEKQPEQRYQTAEQFKTVVETMAAGFKDSGTGSPRSEPNVRASLADRREEPRSAAVSTTRVPGRLTGLARGCFFMAGTVFLVGIGLLLLLAIGGIIVSLALPAYHRAKSQATARYSDASDSASNAQPADSFAAAIPTDHPVTWVESGKPAEVQLGRGISVEIVGVLRDPRNSNGWIKPDGSVFGSAPAAVVQLAEPRPIDSPAPTIIPENEVLVYYRIGTPEGVTIRKRGLRWQPQPWTLDYGRGAFPTVRDTSGDLRYTVGHFALREAVPALDLTVELVASDARWEPMAEFDGKSTKELVPNCMVVFSPPRFDESANRHVIDVMHNIPRKDHTLRLVAYSKGGQRTEIDFHPGATSGTPTKGFALVYPDEVKVDEVEKWVLERTPWLRGEIRNIAVQPRPASAGTATFGPVMERMINDPDYMQGSEALDLDTGLSLSHPANLESVDDLMTWLAQNEADLLAGRRDGWMIGTAETNELKLVLLPEDSWATETAAGLDARLAAAPRNVLIKEPRRDEPVKVYTLPDSQPFPHTFGFQTHQGSTGILQFTGFTDDARGVKLRYKLVEGVRGLHQASASSKRQRFVPEPGMANQTSWMVFDKPSFLNTNGWAVMSRLTIGGVAKIEFPEEAERRCDIELLRGDDTSITVRIHDLARNGVMTLSLVRDQPGEITVDGAGYRVTYLSVYIARDKPDTSAFAQVVVTPVNETASRSEPANSPDLARTRSSVTDTTRVQLMESDPHRRTWRWRVFREPGARMVYGILDVTDPDNPQQLLLGMENEPLSLTSSQDYTLRLNLDQDGWRMEIESAWVGENGGRGANWDRLEIPPGATLHATLPEQLSELNTSRYHVFWMGTLELDGRVLKRLRFVARLAEAADPVQNMFDDTDGVRTFDVAPDFEARAHRMGTNFVRMRPGLMPLGARMALLLLPVLLIMAVPLGGAVWWITAGIKHGSALQRSALLLAAGGPLLAAVFAFVLDNLGIIGHLVFITALLACEIPAFCFGLMSRQTGLGKAAMIVSATIVIISLFLLL